MEYHTSKIMKTSGTVQSIPYTIFYRRGVRMITLRISPQGSVHVCAPYHASKREIENLIIRNKGKLLERMPEPRDWEEGETLVFHGREMRLSVQPWRTHAVEHGDELIAGGGSSTEVRGQVKELYRMDVARRVRPLVSSWCSSLGVRVGSITIRDTHRVWASCTRAGNLNFSLRCAGLDDDDLSYLVLHELAHRVHFNHGPLFHAYLDAHMPGWKSREQHLRVMQPCCDVFGG